MVKISHLGRILNPARSDGYWLESVKVLNMYRGLFSYNPLHILRAYLASQSIQDNLWCHVNGVLMIVLKAEIQDTNSKSQQQE